MTDSGDAGRFAEVIIRDWGARALDVVRRRIRLLEHEQRHAAAELWCEIAAAIEERQTMEPERDGVE